MATLLIWAAVSGGMTALRDVFRSSPLCQGGGRIYPQARPGALEPFRPCGGGRMRRLGCDSGQGGCCLQVFCPGGLAYRGVHGCGTWPNGMAGMVVLAVARCGRRDQLFPLFCSAST